MHTSGLNSTAKRIVQKSLLSGLWTNWYEKKRLAGSVRHCVVSPTWWFVVMQWIYLIVLGKNMQFQVISIRFLHDDRKAQRVRVWVCLVCADDWAADVKSLLRFHLRAQSEWGGPPPDAPSATGSPGSADAPHTPRSQTRREWSSQYRSRQRVTAGSLTHPVHPLIKSTQHYFQISCAILSKTNINKICLFHLSISSSTTAACDLL